MSGRVKIKIKDKKPKIDVFKVIESRFKNMNELRDLIDMDPRKGLVMIRDGAGFREVVRPAYPPSPHAFNFFIHNILCFNYIANITN